MKWRGRKLGLALGLVVVLGSFVYLVAGEIGGNLVYFVTPGELLEQGARAHDKPVKLGGQVKPGTIQWDPQAMDLRFVVQDSTGELAVRAHNAPPPMFREGMGVVLEGTLTRASVFEATNLLIKHSNEYRAPEDGEHPMDVQRTLLKGGSS
jgi:cytochrome c-type biogenesis protein CcmE